MRALLGKVSPAWAAETEIATGTGTVIATESAKENANETENVIATAM